MKSQDEQYIIQLIREGKTNLEIADTLHTTELAIKDKVHRLLRKYNCKNRTQLATAKITFSRETI